MFLSLSKKYSTKNLSAERLNLLKKHSLKHRIPITHFELWDLALTHLSFSDNNDGISYERLEFLGDSVLGLCLAEILFIHYPDMSEGKMSMLKSSLANEKTLATIGRELDLLNVVKLGNGEKLKDKRAQEKVLCDLFESSLAVIFIQHGIKKSQEFVQGHFLPKIESLLIDGVQDYKTRLQKITVKVYKEYPKYEILDAEGPDHGKIFTVQCNIENFVEVAKGRSKKEAEQQAAAKVLKKMEEYILQNPLSPLVKEFVEN